MLSEVAHFPSNDVPLIISAMNIEMKFLEQLVYFILVSMFCNLTVCVRQVMNDTEMTKKLFYLER